MALPPPGLRRRWGIVTAPRGRRRGRPAGRSARAAARHRPPEAALDRRRGRGGAGVGRELSVAVHAPRARPDRRPPSWLADRTMSPPVLVYRETLVAPSEPFITGQGEGLARHEAWYLSL